MPSSIKFGKIGGIEVGVHWSWIPIFILFTWLFATGTLDHFFPHWSTAAKWIAGGVTSAIFFASLLAHELAHSFVARSKGLEVKGITLFFIGGVSNLGGEPRSAGDEFQISVVGPLTSLLMGGLFGIGWLAIHPFSPGIAGVSAQLAVINASLAVFNMVPGFPLDGGRVFRSIIWQRTRDLRRATRIASMAGEGVGYLLMGAGVVFFIFGNVIGGVFYFVIGLFLRGIAAGSYQQMVVDETLAGLKARDAAMQNCEVVSPDRVRGKRRRQLRVAAQRPLLSRAIGRRPARARHAGGHPARAARRVADHARRKGDDFLSTACTPSRRTRTCDRCCSSWRKQDINQVPVVEDGQLIGLISRSDILRLIQTRRELQEHQPR